MTYLPGFRYLLTCFLQFLLILVLSATLHARTFETASEYYEDALDLVQEGKYREAVIQLKNSLQLDNKHIPSMILLGEAYLNLDEIDSAEIILSKARHFGADEDHIAELWADMYQRADQLNRLEEYVSRRGRSDPIESRLRVILGMAYLRNNFQDKAIDAFNAASELDPDNHEPLLARATIALNNDDLETTGELLEYVREMAPGNPAVWMLQGDYFEGLGDHRAALKSYQKAIELDPDNPAAITKRAKIHLMLDDYRRVLRELKPFVNDENLYDPEILYLYSLALARSGDMKESDRIMEEASKKLNFLSTGRKVNDPSILMLTTAISMLKGDYLRANDSAEQLVKLLPKHTGARYTLGKTYMALERYTQALEIWERLLPKFRNNPEFLALYGRALYKTGNPEEAVRVIEKAISISGDSSDLISDLALSRIAMGDAATAIKELEKAMDEKKIDSRAGTLLSYTQISQGDLEGAEVTADFLMAREPENPVLHNLLGAIEAARGNTEKATIHFNDAVTLDPGFIPARMNLVKLDIQSDNLESAKTRLNQIMEIDAKSRDGMKGLAHVSELNNDVEKSIWWLERLWSFYPNLETEPEHLIELYIKQGNYKKALFAAKKHYEYHSDKPRVLRNLVNAYMLNGEKDKAIELLKYRIQYPDRLDTVQLYNLAEMQSQLGDKNGSYSTMQTILEKNPDFIPAKYSLVKLESSFGNHDRALELIEEIRQVEGESAVLESLHGDVLVFTGKHQEALDVFKAANKKFPGTGLQLKLFRLRMKMGKQEEALAELEDWVKKNPENIEAVYGLAIAYIDSARYKKAIELHEQLLGKTGDDISIQNNLAWLYQKTGDERALDMIKTAHERDPYDPSVLDTYGWILTETGNPREGLNYLRLAMSLEANDPAIQYHLALALSRLNRNKEA
ncbi:MAG: PEP-CTERM system TPR-repeat protein PrsT, partial [Gammaproteobacteria bacterium]|nr:PEP-CTERM system TPR-repeat protein PrsT [Gammaproteobacteria bacterium]